MLSELLSFAEQVSETVSDIVYEEAPRLAHRIQYAADGSHIERMNTSPDYALAFYIWGGIFTAGIIGGAISSIRAIDRRNSI
jgi:hypothetical protein